MTGDDTIRLTYAELAEARGVSLGAARRMVYRHRWQKQVGNDGLSHILVPRAFATRDPDTPDVSADATRDVSDDHSADVTVNGRHDVSNDPPELRVVAFDEAIAAFTAVSREASTDVSRPVILTLQEAITSLRSELDAQRDQLSAERDRADRADDRAQEAERRAQTAENRLRDLQEQLTAEMAEHRRIVGMLTEQLATRRSWWPWRRRA